MEQTLNNNVIQEILKVRLPETKEFQKCSFILPNGKFYIMEEHYEAYKFLVVEELVSCIPDAEQLLSDLGFIRYSWIGYLTLPDKGINSDQYESLEIVLMNISKYRDKISIQIQSQPKFYIDFDLDDIPYIIDRVKLYYTNGKLFY